MSDGGTGSTRDGYVDFLVADGICREGGRGRITVAFALTARARALEAMGFADDAMEDYRSAIAADPGHVPALEGALHLRGDEAAATALAHAAGVDAETRWEAITVILRGREAVILASRDGRAIHGMLATRHRSYLAALAYPGQNAPVPLSERREKDGVHVYGFSLAAEPESAVRLRAFGEAGTLAEISLPPTKSARIERRAPSEGIVDIVVPIHMGSGETAACLDSIASATSRYRLNPIVVDDGSPDRDLESLAYAACEEGNWHLVRRGASGGWAAAVNDGFAASRGALVLLLHADVVLPPDAVDRLADAARSDPGIGIAVPLSNRGGPASFPSAGVDAPWPADADAIDAAAASANRGTRVEIPWGPGSCMMITRECLDAVGEADLRYGRGRGADQDLCLRAARAGFKTVAAADVYVPRRGGTAPDGKFPDHMRVWEAHHGRDPLARARAAVESLRPPDGPIAIVAGRPSRVGPVFDLAPAGRRTIIADWSDGIVRLRAVDGGEPRSVAFRADDVQGLERYLSKADPLTAMIAEPDDTPQGLLDALVRAGATMGAVAVDAAGAMWLKGGKPGWAWMAGGSDRRIAAALGDMRPRPRRTGEPDEALPRVIAIPYPVDEGKAERRIAYLQAALRRDRVARAVVFGEYESMGGPLRATGKMEPREYATAIRHHGATHVFLPYDDRFFGLAEAMACEAGLPLMFFGWPGSPIDMGEGDLALDVADDGMKAAEAVVAAVAGRARPAPSTNTVRRTAPAAGDHAPPASNSLLRIAASAAVAGSRGLAGLEADAQDPGDRGRDGMPEGDWEIVDVDGPEDLETHRGAGFTAAWWPGGIEALEAEAVGPALAALAAAMAPNGAAVIVATDFELVSAAVLEHGVDHPVRRLWGSISLHTLAFGDRGATHRSAMTRERMARLARDAGFSQARAGSDGESYTMWAILGGPETDMDAALSFVPHPRAAACLKKESVERWTGDDREGRRETGNG